MGMGFDSKHDFTPPTILWGLLLCPWTEVSFFGEIEHSPADDCSAASCNLEFFQEKMRVGPSTLPSRLLSKSREIFFKTEREMTIW